MGKNLNIAIIITVFVSLCCICIVTAEKRSDLVFDIGGGVEIRDSPTYDRYIASYVSFSPTYKEDYSYISVLVYPQSSNAQAELQKQMDIEKESTVSKFTPCSVGDECYVAKRKFSEDYDTTWTDLHFTVNNYFATVSKDDPNNKINIFDFAEKIATVLAGDSSKSSTSSKYSLLLKYLKDPGYSPLGFQKIPDSIIEQALSSDKTGSTDILMNELMPSVVHYEVMANAPIPDKDAQYDPTLFGKDQKLSSFLSSYLKDSGTDIGISKFFEYIDDGILTKPTFSDLVGLNSLTGLYSTGMKLAEYYRDNVFIPEITSEWRKSYYELRKSGISSYNSMKTILNDDYNKYGAIAGLYQGTIRKGKSEEAVAAALEEQYLRDKNRQDIMTIHRDKVTFIWNLFNKNPKYVKAIETILNSAQNIAQPKSKEPSDSKATSSSSKPEKSSVANGDESSSSSARYSTSTAAQSQDSIMQGVFIREESENSNDFYHEEETGGDMGVF